MCSTKITWSVAGGVTSVEYPVMLMCSEKNPGSVAQRNVNFSSANVCGTGFNLSNAYDDAIYYVATDSRRLSACGTKIEAFADVVDSSPCYGNCNTNYGGAYQDRSYYDDKLYAISANGPSLIYSNGDVQTFIVGWGARKV